MRLTVLLRHCQRAPFNEFILLTNPTAEGTFVKENDTMLVVSIN